jgi:hypothetical protein
VGRCPRGYRTTGRGNASSSGRWSRDAITRSGRFPSSAGLQTDSGLVPSIRFQLGHAAARCLPQDAIALGIMTAADRCSLTAARMNATCRRRRGSLARVFVMALEESGIGTFDAAGHFIPKEAA